MWAHILVWEAIPKGSEHKVIFEVVEMLSRAKLFGGKCVSYAVVDVE